MKFAVDREKSFAYAAFALYGLGLFLGAQYIVLAALAFTASGVCAYNTVSPNADNLAQQRRQIYFLLAVLMLPTLFMLWTGYQDGFESRRFRSYLAEHHCKHVREVVIGMSKGGCDRAGNCEDPQEIEESEFFCASTGNHITYSDFKVGRYGR